MMGTKSISELISPHATATLESKSSSEDSVEVWYFFQEKKKNLGVAATLVKASAFKIFNFQLDLTLKDGKGGDISSFIPNGEWDLIGKINFLLELTFLNLHEKHSNFVIKRSIFLIKYQNSLMIIFFGVRVYFWN